MSLEQFFRSCTTQVFIFWGKEERCFYYYTASKLQSLGLVCTMLRFVVDWRNKRMIDLILLVKVCAVWCIIHANVSLRKVTSYHFYFISYVNGHGMSESWEKSYQVKSNILWENSAWKVPNGKKFGLLLFLLVLHRFECYFVSWVVFRL